jgi:hypothetical protein
MVTPDGSALVPRSAEARWLRASLTGNAGERRRVAHEELAGGPPFQVTPLACGVAARRLFGMQWDRRVMTIFAGRLVDRTPAAAGLNPRDIEAILRGMTGEIDLLTAIPGVRVTEIFLALLFGLADELALDDRAVDELLVEAERETAAAANLAVPPPADEAPVLDDDRWRRTFERHLTDDEFVPRAHPVARPFRPFSAEDRRFELPASKAGRYLRDLVGREPKTGPKASEVPLVDQLRVARLAFTIAVRTFLHTDPDLAETMAVVLLTRSGRWPGIDVMKAEYLIRTIFKEKVPLDGITNRDVLPSSIFMLYAIVDAWDGDDGAICSVIADAEEGVARRGNVLAR